KAMPSKARTPKKVLPNTGEVPSILAVLGSGLLGFLGIAHTKKKKKNKKRNNRDRITLSLNHHLYHIN
ncbi:LPXTG cell wall anchor domain-containing protein, partial [Streptococcus ruminantium]|nr:LPXTG cell wall anchor domain-containing protein [Streptococcus ruminantium]